MERHYDRSDTMLPLELFAASEGGRTEYLGSSMDVSKGGMRVQTRLPMIPGQEVDVFLRGVTKLYAFCRVVWAHPCVLGHPAEAGLQIVKENAAVVEPDDDFLAELRRVYHNPASAHKFARRIQIDFSARHA
jgi:PilZ domain